MGAPEKRGRHALLAFEKLAEAVHTAVAERGGDLLHALVRIKQILLRLLVLELLDQPAAGGAEFLENDAVDLPLAQMQNIRPW